MSEVHLNLLSPEVAVDPFPFYAALRRDSPVCRVEPGGFWAVSRYEDAAAVVADPVRFSSRGVAPAMDPPWLQLEFNAGAHSMVVQDPPEHTRLRSMVNRAFGPALLAATEGPLRALAERLADGLGGGDEVDFVSAFATPLVASVIGGVLGLDPTRHAQFKRWSDVLGSAGPVSQGPEHDELVRSAYREMHRHCDEVIEARRREPGSDLMSALLQIRAGEQALTDRELHSFFHLLFIAGLETTVHLIAKSVMRFADHPEEMARLRAEPAMIPRYLEEMLRYDPSVHFIFRQAPAEATLAGGTIPAGSFILVMLASANRDEARFPKADVFDMDRDTRGHLAFGHGPHTCLGLALARMEARIALETLLTRFQRFERRPGPPEWMHTIIVRGLARLPVRAIPA
ncbi:cytochrome P450 [Chondromyces crocatus]|uniref:Cytochrome P450 n=1 Tax=Chondromyces crocatus TaxID=52 RepID=A0A0K1EC95_CHOCO|nr:cytochrome P450 [Chondromyces crocatus]AKT38183.1 cytochrome P450 [Chondromyces crocatus]